MEIDALDWSIMTLVYLYDVLRAKVVKFYFFVVGAGGNAVA